MYLSVELTFSTPPQNLLVPIRLEGFLNTLVLATPTDGNEGLMGDGDPWFHPNESTTFEQTDQTVTFAPYSNNTGTLVRDAVRLNALANFNQEFGTSSRSCSLLSLVMPKVEDMKELIYPFGVSAAAVGFAPGPGFARDLLRGPHNKEIALFLTPFNKDAPNSYTNQTPYDLNAGELTIG